MYYKAKEINQAPFLIFDIIAKTEKGLTKLNLSYEHPLVLIKSELPEIVNGVCVKKIERGVLVDRTESEIIEKESAAKLESESAIKEELKSELSLLIIKKSVLEELKESVDDVNSEIAEVKNKYTKVGEEKK